MHQNISSVFIHLNHLGNVPREGEGRGHRVGVIATMSLKHNIMKSYIVASYSSCKIQLTKLLREASRNTVIKHSSRAYGRPQERIMT